LIRRTALASWSLEEIARGREWVAAWRLDAYEAIALLCGPTDYTVPPRAPKPTSGLIEQQRFFGALKKP
jgi:hypothetical protein